MNTATQDQVHKPTSREVGLPTKPLVVKYTTHLPPEVIKWVKREALEHDLKDYEIVTRAVEAFRRGQPAA